MSASRERYPFDDYLTGNLARDTAFRALIECPTYGTVDAVLDAYRDEVLREAAEKIRTKLPETVKERLGGGVWTITTIPTAKQAADLIDPEATP